MLPEITPVPQMLSMRILIHTSEAYFKDLWKHSLTYIKCPWKTLATGGVLWQRKLCAMGMQKSLVVESCSF